MLFLWLLLLPSARAEVDCHMACTHCRDEVEEAALVEVYCAMCRECRERRRERRQMQHEVQMRERSYGWESHEQQSIPPGCPTAPPCSEETREPLKQTVQTTCATVPPTTCPPIIACKPKRAKATTKIKLAQPTPVTIPISLPMAPPIMPMFMPMCMPCGAMCPCTPVLSSSAATPAPTKEKLNMLDPEPTTKDFFYVYIGLPKDALNKVDK